MKLAIYDFDGTLFDEETLPFIVKYYGKNKYSKSKLIKFYAKIVILTLKYKLKIDRTLDKEKYRAAAANIFMILFEGTKKEGVVDFFSDCTKEIVKHLNGDIVTSVEEKKAEGFHTVLCSGANTLLLEEVSKHVKFDTVIGTELVFLPDGAYDYNAAITIITGKNKAIALLERFKDIDVNWEDSFAYGDSYYDYDMLKLTGNPIAVKPDEGLRRIATENAWSILG